MIRKAIYPPYKNSDTIPSHLSNERLLPVNINKNKSRLDTMTTAISKLLLA
jgi:hypothetical protein